MRSLLLLLVCLCILFSFASQAQSPGLIIIPATGAGASILDPNSDGFTSKTSQGFKNNDVDTSETELKFKVIRPFFYEPVGDLMRGPSGKFSDIVTQIDSSGFYVFADGTRLLFRLRIGDYIPGSKGYSVLIDTDARFGATGPNADPGYTAATTAHNGNPGFEFEVTLETNFRVAVYNVDTPGKVVLKYGNTPVTAYSQISVAQSTVSGNPDYFYDFYVPYSQLGINANTPLRMIATTVMSPQSAIGGPKSDIYGVGSTTDYMAAWTQAITYQTPTTPATLNTPASINVPVCTAPPTVTAPVVGATSISGSWTRLDATKSNTALIRIYRNNIIIDSVTATSGAGWTKTITAVAASDVFYATAQATGEGNCFASNSARATSCTAGPTPRPAVTCSANKGLDGTFVNSGTRIRIYTNVVPGNADASSFTLFADSAAAPSNFASVTIPFVLHSNGTRQWKCDGTDGNGNPGTITNTACNGGNAIDMPANTTLAITAQELGRCQSMPVFVCPNGTQTTTPVIAQATLYPGTKISGTSAANAYLRLYVDSTLKATLTADGSGNFTFPDLGLTSGNSVLLCAQSSGTCVSNFSSKTVSCYTTPPVISTDNNGRIALGATSISGTSAEANGTAVRIYKKTLPSGATSLVGSTTVSSGAWSLTIPASVATDRYVVTQQNGTCSMSDSSGYAYVPSANTTSCPAFGAASYSSSVSSVSGTVSPSLTAGVVYLYIDGIVADSATNVTSSFSINTNTSIYNKLYAGATLTATAKTSGGSEKTDCSSPTTASVTCTMPATATYSVSRNVIFTGDMVNVNVSNATAGYLYTITNNPYTGKAYGTSAFATGASLTLPSYTFNTPGSYDLSVRVVNITEGSSCASNRAPSTLIVSSTPLPAHLVSFDGSEKDGKAMLEWNTGSEEEGDYMELEHSADARAFSTIATIDGKGSNSSYNYTDAGAAAGTNYYRLKMLDAAGKTAYSNVVLVNIGSTKQTVLIYPNPATDRLYIAASGQGGQVIITDVNGRMCGNVTMSGNTAELNVSALPAGTYFIRYMQGANSEVHTIIKR